jgi:long-chain acyl-CoA synthetase
MNHSDKPWLTQYDLGVPHEIDIPHQSLVDLLKQAVALYRESTCVIYKGQEWRFEDIDELSDRIARYLISIGINKGDRVGVLLGNTPEFVISYYGILKAGGVVMALNPAFRSAEIEIIAIESGVKVMLLAEENYGTICNLKNTTNIASCVVVSEDSVSLQPEDITWRELVLMNDEVAGLTVDVSPDDPAVFQYSGGTTGTPKCAVGLHRNLVANVYQFNHWLVNTKPGKETILIAIPVYHVYGMVLGMNLAVKMGARMLLIDNPRNLDNLLSAIEEYHATVFPGVPNLYAAINQYSPVLAGKFNLSSIKACISGSATLPIRVKQEFEALTHGHLVEGYGLSEAPTATHCNPILGENREGSIGLPLPNVDCKVVDLETGLKALAPGEIGELIVRGPQVMWGYHQRPDETDFALRDGWLFTGDVVRMDSDGYFYLVDRKKDVIKVGGFQVWPNEVEAIILKHDKVREVAVAGVLDENGGEVVKAWVVLKDGESATPDEITLFCDQFLTRYKIPKYIEFRSCIPKTMVGKTLRRVLVSEHTL